MEEGVSTSVVGSKKEASGSSQGDPQLLMVGTALAIGAVLALLSTTIVSVGIGRFSEVFSAPLSTIQWVSTAYLLAIAVAIPITGWGMDRFGEKKLWMASFCIFLVGSALAALAWSIGTLIFARVIQGIGGGMFEPIMLTLLARAAGPRRITTVMSMIQIPITLAPVFGPMFGGVIIDNLSWQWLFLVNLPIGLAGVLMAGRVLSEDPPRTERTAARLDLLGVVSLPPALAALLVAFSQFGDGGGVSSPAVLTALVVGLVLLLAYTTHALRVGAAALIDLRLFANPQFSVSAITAFLFGASAYGIMFLLPLYYQQAEGLDALRSGLLLAPQGIGIILILPLVGRLTARFGARAVVFSGMAIAVLGTVAYATVEPGTSTALLIGSLVVRGIGLGTTLAPALSSAFRVTAPEAASRASSTLIAAIQLGGSVGTALLAVILQQQLSGNVGDAAVHTSFVDHPHLAVPLALAFGHTFWWALGICALGALVALLLPGREHAHTDHS